MVRWTLSHQDEDEEGFDAAQVLTAWAKKRGRVAWSSRPRPFEREEQNPKAELARMLVDHWGRHPEELVAILDRVEASPNIGRA